MTYKSLSGSQVRTRGLRSSKSFHFVSFSSCRQLFISTAFHLVSFSSCQLVILSAFQLNSLWACITSLELDSLSAWASRSFRVCFGIICQTQGSCRLGMKVFWKQVQGGLRLTEDDVSTSMWGIFHSQWCGELCSVRYSMRLEHRQSASRERERIGDPRLSAVLEKYWNVTSQEKE